MTAFNSGREGIRCIIFLWFILTTLSTPGQARSVVGDSPRGPPIILSNELKPLQVVQLGQEFRIICPIEGDPTPIIDWYKDGESITPAWSPRFRINGRTLRIRSMYSEDAGIYECKGVNGFGSQLARTRLIVSDEEMVDGDQKLYSNHPSNSNDRRRDSLKASVIPPKFTPETTEQTGPLHVTYGNTIRLRCEAKGTPTPKINWLKNGKSVGDKLWKWSSWTLILSKLTVEDSGVYTCVANSTAGKIELNIQLYVTEIVEKRRPELATGDPNNTTVMVGSEASLECIVRASLSTLPPHIKWLKRVPDDDYYLKSSVSSRGGGGGGRHKHRLLPNDNHHVLVIQETQDKGIRITESQRNGTFISKLIIANSDSSHSGSYICLATNSAGYSFKEIAILKVVHSDGPTPLTNSNSFSTSASTTIISFPVLVIGISLVVALLMVGGACALRKYQENQPKQLSKSIVPKKLSSSTSSNGTTIPLPSILISNNNYNSSPSKYHHLNHHRHSATNNKDGHDCHQLLVSTTSTHSSSSSSGGHHDTTIDASRGAGMNHFAYGNGAANSVSASNNHRHLHHHHHHHGRGGTNHKIAASDNPMLEMTLSKCNCFEHESLDMDDRGSRIYEQCHPPYVGSSTSHHTPSYCGHWT